MNQKTYLKTSRKKPLEKKANFNDGIVINSSNVLSCSYAFGIMPNRYKRNGIEVLVKTLDILDSATVSSSGSIVQISDAPQGISNNQRIGDWIKPLGLDLKYIVSGEPLTSLGCTLRVIVLRWRPNFGLVTIVPTSILDNLTNALTMSNYRWDLKDQFDILFDRIHSLAGNGTTGSTASLIQHFLGHVDMTAEGQSRRIKFESGLTNAQSNGIFVLLVSDNNTAALPTVLLNTRLYYYDQ